MYAILYERVFIIKYLLKTYPALLNVADNVSNTKQTIING